MNDHAFKPRGFSLQPSNLQEAIQISEMLAHSNMVPKHYKGQPSDTLVAMMMGTELGLNPIQSLQNIAVINSKPAIYGDALLALVQNHPAFGGIAESFDEANLIARCTVWRKGGEKHTSLFGQGDAVTAGLWNKQGPWQQYPKRMLQMRARGFALRDQFADALLGLITVEEAQDYPLEKVVNTETLPVHIAAPSVVVEEPALPDYPDESFNSNLAKWEQGIAAGKLTPAQIISRISSKFTLTNLQHAAILDLGEAA